MNKTPSVPELQSKWFELHDLDRANAIRALRDSGISIRQIAAQLQKSESSLRRLLVMLDAPILDRLLHRRGKITANELVRRSKAAGLQRAARNQEELKLERERQTLRAANRICNWLIQTQMNRPSCEMMVDEVRRRFNDMAQAGLHPTREAPPDTPIDTIIERTRPPELTDDSIDIVAWYAQWLTRWTFFAFPNPEIRDNALDIALERQMTR